VLFVAASFLAAVQGAARDRVAGDGGRGDGRRPRLQIAQGIVQAGGVGRIAAGGGVGPQPGQFLPLLTELQLLRLELQGGAFGLVAGGGQGLDQGCDLVHVAGAQLGQLGGNRHWPGFRLCRGLHGGGAGSAGGLGGLVDLVGARVHAAITGVLVGEDRGRQGGQQGAHQDEGSHRVTSCPVGAAWRCSGSRSGRTRGGLVMRSRAACVPCSSSAWPVAWYQSRFSSSSRRRKASIEVP